MRCRAASNRGDFAYFAHVCNFSVVRPDAMGRIMLLVILACLLFYMWRIPGLMKSKKSTEAQQSQLQLLRQPVHSGVFEHRRRRSKVKQLYF